MQDLSGKTAATEKEKRQYRVVWLAELDTTLVADDSAVTLYYASRELTLSGQLYTDGLNPAGISLGWATLRERGGLAPVADMTVRIASAGGITGSLSAYHLDNSTVRILVVFVTGAETSADAVLVRTGTVETITWDQESITLGCIDTSDQGWREVPTHKVTLGEFPYAPASEYGAVVPMTFGAFPDVADPGQDRQYAATRCLDLYLPAFTACYYAVPDANPNLYEWVAEANIADRPSGVGALDFYGHDWAVTDTPGDIIGPNAQAYRSVFLLPFLPMAENTAVEWRSAVNGDPDTDADIGSGELLGVQWPGTPTLGTISSVNLLVELESATGSAEISLKYDGAQIASYSGNSSLNEDITALLAGYYEEAWHFEKLSITIQRSGGDLVEVLHVYLLVTYLAAGATSTTQMRPWYLSEYYGMESDIAHQSIVIDGTQGEVASGPVSQLLMALTGKDLFNLAAGKIDSASWATAYALRDSVPWLTHYQLMGTVGWDFWDALCFQCGLHLVQDYAARWKVIARVTEATPVAAFGPQDIALTDPRHIASAPDLSASLTATRDVINEIVLRYDYDPTIERYRQVAIRTAQHRYTGTCTVDESAGTLTDSAASFLTGDYAAAVGDRVYVLDKFTVLVTSVNSDTELGIMLWPRETAVLADVVAETAYYGGPGVSGKMVKSWLRYGTINPLQGAYDPAQDAGGYTSAFFYAETGETAELALDYLESWFCMRRMTVEFGTYLKALDLELGDVVAFGCPGLPTSVARATTLATAIDSSTMTVSVADATGMANLSYIVIGDECCQVVAEPDGNTLTVQRGQVSTTAAAHKAGAIVSLSAVLWEVVGIQPVPASGMVRLRLTETPIVAPQGPM